MYIEINRPLHPNNCQNIYQNGYHGVARRMPYEFVYLMIMMMQFNLEPNFYFPIQEAWNI